jgi:hypothetical protein
MRSQLPPLPQFGGYYAIPEGGILYLPRNEILSLIVFR